MKIDKTICIVSVIVCSLCGCNDRTEMQPIRIEEEKPEPAKQVEEALEYVSHVEPVKPIEKVVASVKEIVHVKSPEESLREVFALQKDIEVPHTVGSVSVIRIMPDGISVMSSTGIRKIQMEGMLAEDREKYHIKADAGKLYRELMSRRRRAGAKARAKEEKAAKAKYAQNQARERAEKEKQIASVKARNASAAKSQWAEYDRRYAEYASDLENARIRDRSSGRVVKMPTKPKKPRMARP